MARRGQRGRAAASTLPKTREMWATWAPSGEAASLDGANLRDAVTVQRVVRVGEANDLPPVGALVQRVGLAAAMVRRAFEVKHIACPHMRHTVGIDLSGRAQKSYIPVSGLQGGDIGYGFFARLNIDMALVSLTLQRYAVIVGMQQRVHGS